MTEAIYTNRTYDELSPGDSASLTRVVNFEDIELFAVVSGDMNPSHLLSDFQHEDGTDGGRVVAHSMWTASLISAVLGTRLPGPGTIYIAQDLRFLAPVSPGDTVTVTVSVHEKGPAGRVSFFTTCTNQRGEIVVDGTATVRAPARSITWRQEHVPAAEVRHGGHYAAIIDRARALGPLAVAVVHPCSPAAILGAVEIHEAGLFDPLLIGPEAKIRAAAEEAGVSLDGLVIENVEHSHAAAARGVELAAARKVAVLMKGSLHTDELLGAVINPAAGLRTERRMSHVFVMDVPAYPKLIAVTDAAINIAPDLMQKRDICQNAVDMFHRLGVARPKVAVLAAVETVNAKMPSTLDAAALCVMAMRGQITGAEVDGPLAFDNAISAAAAQTKGIVSPVAGDADILLVPDLESGNMLAKQLTYLAGATAAGLVLGTRAPIILTSRSDPLAARLASAALARILVADPQELAGG